MNRRATYRPASRITYREHIAAALGAATGMLSMTLLAVGMVITR